MSPQLMTPRDGFLPHETTNTQIPIMKESGPDVTKWIGLLLTFIGMCTGMAVWASNEHSSLKEWTIDQNYETRTEIKEIIKESYVPLHEFTRLKQKLEDQSKKMDDMSSKLDKVLDEMHQINRGKKR